MRRFLPREVKIDDFLLRLREYLPSVRSIKPYVRVELVESFAEPTDAILEQSNLLWSP